MWVLSTFVVFAVIMAGTPVGFPVPQMHEGLDDREALDCFILDYIDYLYGDGMVRSERWLQI